MKVHPRRRRKGAAAVETALSLTILLLLFSVLISIGHMMIMRQKLLGATSRAARICSLVQPGARNQCARAQVEGAMGAMIAADGVCRGLQVVPESTNLGGVDVFRLRTRCSYSGGPWSGVIERWGNDPQGGRLAVSAEATMPTR
jgi:hypothetical protein